MIFICIVGTSFTMLRLFSHKLSSSINTLFTHLCETLWAGSVKFFAEASELFKHVVIHLVVVLKSASSECITQGGPKDGNRRVLNRYFREGCGEQSTPLIPSRPLFADWSTIWFCFSCRRKTWFNFLFGRTLRIRCFNFFNISSTRIGKKKKPENFNIGTRRQSHDLH